MRRLERLGSAAFFTVVLTLVYHLLSMSFFSMLKTTCVNCNGSSPLQSWETSLRERCYVAPMKRLFAIHNKPTNVSGANSFTTTVCVPNQYLVAKSRKYAYNCLLVNIDRAHTVCSIGNYDPTQCKCVYSSSSNAATAFSILTALILGLMIFLSHLVSYVKIDYVLKWLIPLCFGLLVVAVLFIVIVLADVSANKNEDVHELIYSATLVKQAFNNKTLYESWVQTIKANSTVRYTVKLGWCFGLEVLALHAAVVSAILFALMFTAKRRPEPSQPRT